jgi:5-methylcytosine-specific restriction enzyme A
MAMPRTPPEWIGKNDDTPIPPAVRVRVFDRNGGVCHISGRRIRPGDVWHCDHVVPLIAGGQHRESNLAPILLDPHKAKTKAEVAEKSRVARKRKAFLGLKKKRTITRWRKFDGTIVTKPRER